jgi:hypothetical protein
VVSLRSRPGALNSMPRLRAFLATRLFVTIIDNVDNEVRSHAQALRMARAASVDSLGTALRSVRVCRTSWNPQGGRPVVVSA